MKKKRVLIILYIIMILFVMLSNVCFSNADSPSTTTTAVEQQEQSSNLSDMYNVLKPGNNPLANATKYVLGIIRWVGTGILIAVIIIKGIKYVTASPEGKADIKKDIIMLTIGAFLLFGFTIFIDIIYDLVTSTGLNS